MNYTKIKGIIPAIGTPVISETKIDFNGLEKITKYMIECQAAAIFATGSMGGCAFFSPEEMYEIIKTVKSASGDKKVLAGVTDTSTNLVINRVRYAEKAKADGIVIAPPHYFIFDEEQMFEHYNKIAEKTDLPIYIYNQPLYSNFNFSIELLQKLKKIDNIVGIKDSGGDFKETINFIDNLKDDNFGIYTGDEKVLGASVLFGADGGVIGTNLNPNLLLNIYKAGLNNDIEKIKKLQNELSKIMKIHEIGDLFAGYHSAFKLMSIFNSDYVRDPVRKLSTTEIEELKIILKNNNLI